jgi:hypothetical protein
MARMMHSGGMRLTCLTLTLVSLTFLACTPSESGTEASAESTGTSGGTDTGSTAGPTDPTTGDAPSTGSGSNSESAETTQPSSGSDTGTDAGTEPDTDPSTDPSTTGLGDGCASLVQGECEADPDCVAVVGQPEDFAGCMPGKQYLGCIESASCDQAETTVCKDGSDEVYKIPNGCIPEGFSMCDGTGKPCEGGGVVCEGLGEDACKAEECAAILGAPHIMKDGGICADYVNQEFLACVGNDVACPPVVQILCPAGQMEPVWDVPSGCIPDGFETCAADLVPECK